MAVAWPGPEADDCALRMKLAGYKLLMTLCHP